MKKQSSAKPKQKMGSIKPIVQYPQGEDYIEDEIDESVQIAKPKTWILLLILIPKKLVM